MTRTRFPPPPSLGRATASPRLAATSHSFVFKLKYSSPTKEETRRYGFTGDLRQEAVFLGLYDRTAQVFGLDRSDFYLVYNDMHGQSLRLSTYQDYSVEVCDPTLDPDSLASCKRDEKKRIVLVFQVLLQDAKPSAPPASETEAVANDSQVVEEAAAPASSAPPTDWEREIEAGLHAPSEPVVAPVRPAPSSTLFTRHSEFDSDDEMPRLVSVASGVTQHHPSTQASRQQYHPYYPTRPHPFNFWTAPPAPPQMPLSALQPPPVPSPPRMPALPFSAPSLPSAPPGLIDIAPRVAQRKEELERRVREFSQRKAALQQQHFGARYRPTPAVVAHDTPAPSSSNGYAPAYSVPVPVEAEVEEHKPVPAPAPSGQDQFQQQLPKELVEGWTGIKTLVKTFVKDFNYLVAENLGAADFELSFDPKSAEAHEDKKVNAEAEKADETLPPAVHKTVFCDRCVRTIVGVRHKCGTCSNYDLCDKCLPIKAHFHPLAHEFGRIVRPGDVPIFAVAPCASSATSMPAEATETKNEEELPVHAATCDLCDRTIKGVRHKCFQCPDFDVCQTCFGNVANLHPLHNFIAIATPSQFRAKLQPGDLVVHKRIACDGCNISPIVGVRYKCAHPDCPDFDLCANCEADPVPRHNWSHPMLKMREPVANVIVGHYVDDEWKGQTRAEEPPRSATAPEMSETRQAALEKTTQLVDATVERATAIQEPETSVKVEQISSPAASVVVKQEQEVEVEEETPESLNASFVADVTLADRSVVPAGGLFNKIWTVRNSGSAAWPHGTHLVNVGGFSKSAQVVEPVEVGRAGPGEVVDIEVELKAPESDGRHMDHWRLADGEGVPFGDRFWVDITVESDEEALRQSGSLSASMVAPSLNASGRTGPSTTTHSAAPTPSVSAASEFDNVVVDEEGADEVVESSAEEESSDEDDEDDEDVASDLDSLSDSGSFVVLTGSERADESDDEEWGV